MELAKGDEIVLACDRHNNETVTLRKHVAKYKHTREWMFEYLSKSESRDNKMIARELEQSPSPNLSIYFNFDLVLVHCDVYILKLTTRAQSLYNEVYGDI